MDINTISTIIAGVFLIYVTLRLNHEFSKPLFEDEMEDKNIKKQNT